MALQALLDLQGQLVLLDLRVLLVRLASLVPRVLQVALASLVPRV